MAKNKQNPLLAQYEAKLEARYRAKLAMAMQTGLDAGIYLERGIQRWQLKSG